LEHEVAQLRQQLALLSAQASDRLLRTPSGKEELFDSEARYRALIELSPQVVWMTDAQGNPTYTNRYWHELSGFTSKETSGTGWTSALHPEDSEAMFKDGWKRLRKASLMKPRPASVVKTMVNTAGT